MHVFIVRFSQLQVGLQLRFSQLQVGSQVNFIVASEIAT
jgi:hypothetical protein